MPITPPIPAIITLNDPVGTDAPVANKFTGNPMRIPRANEFLGDVGNSIQPSAPVQTQALDAGAVAQPGTTTVGTSATLTIAIGAPQTTNLINTSSGVQGYTVSAVTVAPSVNDGADRDNFLPAALGIFFGSLLGAIILWILFGIWLKKRKRAREFKMLGGPKSNAFSTKKHAIRPFILPPPAVHTQFHPDSKPRIMREVQRPISLVASIPETRTHSLLHADFMRETLSDDRHSLASSPDPFRML